MQESQDKTYSNFLKQAFELWINPEIKVRQSEGKIPNDFILSSAQVILSPTEKPVVRLNDEIKAIVKAKINRAIKKGESISQNDVEYIESIKLTEEEVDYGHITIIRLKDSWAISFSFIYDSSKTKSFLGIANNYLESAENDFAKGNYRPMVESLSIAAENIAKARIYQHPDDEIRKAKTHGVIRSKVNIYAKASNIISLDFKDTFNKLLALRDKARYSINFIELKKDEAREMVDCIKKFKESIVQTD